MLKIKKLHLLILRSFVGPFIVTFFVTIFILLMQFLFKYIDDLVGKGLEWYTVVELLLYASSSLVPMALPLAILLSSIMTYGNLGEHFELVAIKSSGISLQKVMLPIFVIIFGLSVGAFFFSNNIIPIANLKIGSLMYDVRQKKPGLAITPGVFYSGIDGYSMRVGGKSKDGQTLYKLMIYDHSENRGNVSVLMADSGKMYRSEDDRYLILKLLNGINYQETKDEKDYRSRRNHMRLGFSEYEVKFDLSEFKLSRTDENLFKDHYTMLNVSQLSKASDSIYKSLDQKIYQFKYTLGSYIEVLDTTKAAILSRYKPEPVSADMMANIPKDLRNTILDRAINTARSIKSYTESAKDEQRNTALNARKHLVEFHRKFTLSVACFVLFFIGAPLGAIIRKGGLGLPITVSVVFFILFHFLNVFGEKMVREGVSTASAGMWMSTAILIPIGLYLTYQATTDSPLFSAETYKVYVRKLFKR